MRIAAIGDVHANASALAGALEVVDTAGYDLLVLLGDLLTYGPDVPETLELVCERLGDARTVLLRGNHDAFYCDLVDGKDAFLGGLQDWVGESVTWTFERLPADLWSELHFQDEYLVRGLIFSHATPFGAGCWEYLNTAAEHERATGVIRERGFQAGVFGHTHRTKWYRDLNGRGLFRQRRQGLLDRPAVHLLNPGAIGQSRDTSNPTPHVLCLSVPDDSVAAAHFCMRGFAYDVRGHVDRVRTSGLSPATVAKVAGFFP